VRKVDLAPLLGAKYDSNGLFSECFTLTFDVVLAVAFAVCFIKPLFGRSRFLCLLFCLSRRVQDERCGFASGDFVAGALLEEHVEYVGGFVVTRLHFVLLHALLNVFHPMANESGTVSLFFL